MLRLFRVVRNLNRLPEVWNAYRKIENWYGLTLRFLGMNNLEYPYQVKTRDGLLLLVQDFCDATTVWTVWCKEEYKVSQDAKVIVDLGANIGAFSIYAAHKSPNAHVISLEPFPSTFKKLVDNILLNGPEKRITCLSYAISDKRNNRTMLSTEFGSATNRFLEVGDTEHQDILEISCMKLEDVLDIIQEKVFTRKVAFSKWILREQNMKLFHHLNHPISLMSKIYSLNIILQVLRISYLRSSSPRTLNVLKMITMQRTTVMLDSFAGNGDVNLWCA